MIINLKSQTDLSGFYIVYKGSCNLEHAGIFGASHYLEHLFCQCFESLHDDLDNQGISWNAYTSDNLVNFHFTGLEENLAPFRNKLVKMMSNFQIPEEKFLNERAIIHQEYLDTFNDQASAHYLNLMRRLFNHYGAIGYGPDILKMTYQDCLDHFERQYSKPDLIINVSKDFEYSNTKIKFKKVDELQKFSTFVDPNVYNLKPNNKVKLEKLNDFSSKTSVIYHAPLLDDLKDFAIVEFIDLMLCMGLNSPLYKEIREKRQVAYSIRLDLGQLGNKGFHHFSTVTTKKNLKSLHEGLKEVLDNPIKYLTKERFTLVNNVLRINLKKRDINRYKNVDDCIVGKEWDVYNIVDKITLKELLEAYDRLISFEKFTRSLDNELV